LRGDAVLFACPLFGGDTDRTPGPITISIAMFGSVPEGTMVRRAGAKAGDKVFVSGTIGDAALGLAVRKDDGAAWKLTNERRQHLLSRYLLPQPRNALAETVRTHASASMDVSDGLAGDLAKLCRVSQVAVEIDVNKVPLSDAAKAVIAADAAMLETALTGGDDYEIVCTVPAGKADSFRAAAQNANVPVNEIGQIAEGEGTRFIGADGQPLSFKRASFSHF
jgi:thiamine-monophosphate kinase